MDEKENPQDNPSGDTPGTSEKEPETFTKEDMAEAERKGKSDGLSEAGRLRAENKKLVASSERLTERLDQIFEEQDAKDRKAAEGNPEQISAIDERTKRRKLETELAGVKSERDEKAEELKTANEEKAEATKERNAREIASRLGVNANLLAKLAKSTDGSTEAIEEIAKELPKKGEDKALKVDSGKTIGGGKVYKSEEVLKTLDPSKMTPKEITEQAKEIWNAQVEGRIK